MANYNSNIDYMAEIKRIKAANPNADVNSLLDAGLAKSKDYEGGKYTNTWQQYYDSNYAKPQQTQQPQQPQIDSTALINNLKQAQINNTVSALDKQRNSQVSNINAEKATIAPQYYDKRNQANVQMNNASRSWNDFIAQRGLTSSGVSAQGTMNNLNAYQGNIGSLNRQEQAANNDISRRLTDTQNNYASDVAAAQSGAEATALQNMINQYNINKQNSYTEAGLTGTLNGQRTLTGQDADRTALQQQAAVIAQANYNDIQAEINRRTAANPNDPIIPFLQAARQEKVQNQASSQAEAATAQQQNALNLWKTLGTATPEIASILGVPVGAKTASYNMDSIQAAISQQNANTNSYQAQTSRINANKTSDTTEKTSTSKVKQYSDQIDKLFTSSTYDADGKKTNTSYDYTQIMNYIQGLNTSGALTDAEAKNLLSLYGFSY